MKLNNAFFEQNFHPMLTALCSLAPRWGDTLSSIAAKVERLPSELPTHLLTTILGKSVDQMA